MWSGHWLKSKGNVDARKNKGKKIAKFTKIESSMKSQDSNESESEETRSTSCRTLKVGRLVKLMIS